MRALTLTIWAVIAAAAVLLEVLGRRGLGGLAPAHQALQRLRSSMAGRIALLVAWMWLGWHVFAR